MSETLTPQTLLVRSPDLVTRKIAGETLLVPITGEVANLEKLFTFNPVGAHVWELLDGVRSLGEIADAVSDSFEVTPEQALADLLELANELVESRLVLIRA